MNTGTINVDEFGYTAISDNTIHEGWYRLSGGFLSGIIHLIIGGVLWYNGLWYMYIPLVSCAVVNLVYGFYEWKFDVSHRYFIYTVTSLFMVLFWFIYIVSIGV